MWEDLKRYLALKSCENEEDAANAIGVYIQRLTPEKCSKYIKKLKEVKF